MIRAFNRYIIHKTLFWFQLFFVPFSFIERRSKGRKFDESCKRLSMHDDSWKVSAMKIRNLLRDELVKRTKGTRRKNAPFVEYNKNYKNAADVNKKSILHRKINTVNNYLTIRFFSFFVFRVIRSFPSFFNRAKIENRYLDIEAWRPMIVNATTNY